MIARNTGATNQPGKSLFFSTRSKLVSAQPPHTLLFPSQYPARPRHLLAGFTGRAAWIALFGLGFGKGR